MNTKNKLLTPKVDIVFHSLFRPGNEAITKAFISNIIKQDIKSINLDGNRYLPTDIPDDKLGILDLKATLDDDTICNVEIQLANNHDTASRLLFYWSKLFSSQLSRGDNYLKLKKTICIAILDYEFLQDIDLPIFHTKWNITCSEIGHTILTDLLELHIIELPTALKHLQQNLNDPIVQWSLFLSDPNNTEVLDMKNSEIEEAMRILDEISQDKNMRHLAQLRQKSFWDNDSAKAYAFEQGLAEGTKKRN